MAGRGSNLAKYTNKSKINLAEGGPDFASFAKFGHKKSPNWQPCPETILLFHCSPLRVSLEFIENITCTFLAQEELQFINVLTIQTLNVVN